MSIEYNKKEPLKEICHDTDLCVVGGGMAGMIAAISAARHGAKVLLMQDRPVLGGNASSEIRMWIRGCRGKNNQETGILEEIFLDNMYRNPERNYSIWDSILYEKVKNEPNITLLLNTACMDLTMKENRIQSVRGFQLTTYTFHTVTARYFADCSGDSILAPLSGAIYRVGREGSSEFGEDIGPSVEDRKTMGMSCLIQARETGRPVKFVPPSWAAQFDDEDMLKFRDHDLSSCYTNFWWMELGGNQDSIHDTEEVRDELLKIAFGVWDHIKNRGDHGADCWELEWVGFLPGKRESRRYVGDYIMTQNDVRSEGKFEDMVAYGGWPMDDHNPDGFLHKGEPTIFHPAPAPFGIPYRCLYSKNIENLFFAGRNISVTHAALSSTRVMGTCSLLGQAVGTAAAMAKKYDCTPRDIYRYHIKELQQTLMDDDCYLPWHKRDVGELTQKAILTASEGDPEVLRNGIDRPVKEEDNGWYGKIGSFVEYRFEKPVLITRCRLVFDSDLERESCSGHLLYRTLPMLCNRFYNMEPFGFPKTMVKDFDLEYLDEEGAWRTLKKVRNNYQRLYKIDVHVVTRAVRFIPRETYGDSRVHVFAFDVR
ncbi:MAG: FAD-dependent oxidoreductase [Clostridia bacterium]|jgi:hypothetical protein